MRHRFWHALARTLRRAWGRAVRPSPAPKRSGEGTLQNAARARFWAEFREGQREAETRTTRP